MNYHSDEWIKSEMKEHLKESIKRRGGQKIVGLFYQGSGNYGLDTANSDVDTKLILVPTLREVAMNDKPISTTHIRENEAHTDEKDIRLYIDTFRKQNLNFLEILFTPYYYINDAFAEQWARLVKVREEIAHMNVWRAVQSMYGIAKEKYHAFEHPYPSKLDILAKYGYDAKQLHHLLRVEEYLCRYIDGESYEDCLKSRFPEYLIDVKHFRYNYKEDVGVRDASMKRIDAICKKFLNDHVQDENQETLELLRDVQYNMIRDSIKSEVIPQIIEEVNFHWRGVDELVAYG